LGGPRGYPLRQTVVVFLCWRDLPAHDEEHYVQDCHLLWQCGQVGEGP
jgi:hypothetical protein